MQKKGEKKCCSRCHESQGFRDCDDCPCHTPTENHFLEHAPKLDFDTPSAKVEELFDYQAIREYWGVHIGPKSSQHMQEKVLYKIYQKLHTRHKAELEAVVKEIIDKAIISEMVTVTDIKAIAEKHGVELQPEK